MKGKGAENGHPSHRRPAHPLYAVYLVQTQECPTYPIQTQEAPSHPLYLPYPP